jgi:hypothetical protein
VDPRRLPGSAHPGHRVHVGRHQGSSVRDDRPRVRRRAASPRPSGRRCSPSWRRPAWWSAT